jgi:predicted NAD/FAD-binding protein
VQAGSQTYKHKIIASYKDRIKVGQGVQSVETKGNKVEITTLKGETFEFDHVVMASHADETLAMLKNPTALQKDLLQHFKYQENTAVLHTDASVMPKMKINWSAWNFVYREGDSFTVYYMNRLQKISDKKSYFININGERFVDKSKILRRIVYHHPIFTQAAIRAQEKLPELNKNMPPVFFCGSYFRYGFHEDALLSSVNLCEEILGRKVLP